VWFGGTDEVHDVILRAFFAVAATTAPRVLVSSRVAPASLSATLGPEVEVLDARPGRRFADPVELEQAVLERGTEGGRVAIDRLDDFVRRLGPERALVLFSHICPQLFDRGALCYWRAGDGARSIRDGVRGITQCVLDLANGRLRIEKAEGRHAAQGRVFRWRVVDDDVEVDEERAIGRLAEGLRRTRTDRQLSQSDLARIGGVSPSAISQAEGGHRGLGLDTVLAIAEGLGIGLDDLLRVPSTPGYAIARRDRTPPRRGVTPLLDDPAVGLRAYLVHLGPGDRGGPPTAHKGPELIVVGDGLIQLDLGTESPVVRAGDAALATSVGVRSWRNLLGRPSRFFWVLRDPLGPDS
jgi:transcriptional regulator with XRE-family HTH domain